MLHHAMGVCPGDEILVPSHTAFPSIEPMIHRGARPVFIDIDETYCMDVDLLEASMSERTVGILPVHLYGHPANMDGFFWLRRNTGFGWSEVWTRLFDGSYAATPSASTGAVVRLAFYLVTNH